MKSSWRITISKIRRAGGLIALGAFSCAGGISAAATIAAAPAQVNPGDTLSPGIADVLKLVDAKVDPEVIKTFVRNSMIYYSPSASEIIMLKERGVPADVVTAMLQRGAELRSQPATAYPGTAPGFQAAQPNTGGPTVISPQPTYVPAPDYGAYYDYSYYYPSYVYPYTYSYWYDPWPWYWGGFYYSYYPYHHYWGHHYPYYGHYPYRSYGSYAYRHPSWSGGHSFGSGAWSTSGRYAIGSGGGNSGLHGPYGYGAPVTGRAYNGGSTATRTMAAPMTPSRSFGGGSYATSAGAARSFGGSVGGGRSFAAPMSSGRSGGGFSGGGRGGGGRR